MEEIKYQNKKPTVEKLLSFGFAEEGGNYCYTKSIADSQLILKITLSHKRVLKAGIFDSSFGDEYVLHRVKDATGAFVGAVKDEYESTVLRVLDECFESDILKTEQAKRLRDYIFEKYGDTPEFPWNDENSIVRRADNKKWYAAFLVIPAKKLGIDSQRTVEVVNLKMPPEKITSTVDGKSIFPAYHMNKKHWITVLFDSGAEFSQICAMVDESFRLVGK